MWLVPLLEIMSDVVRNQVYHCNRKLFHVNAKDHLLTVIQSGYYNYTRSKTILLQIRWSMGNHSVVSVPILKYHQNTNELDYSEAIQPRDLLISI